MKKSYIICVSDRYAFPKNSALKDAFNEAMIYERDQHIQQELHPVFFGSSMSCEEQSVLVIFVVDIHFFEFWIVWHFFSPSSVRVLIKIR